MKHPYKTREDGATVTVFVPYDRQNHCPFCVNKEECADTTGFSVERNKHSIHRMDAITPACDFVFTGGDPFAELTVLQSLLNEVPATHRIFINTMLPASEKDAENLLFFGGTEPR